MTLRPPSVTISRVSPPPQARVLLNDFLLNAFDDDDLEMFWKRTLGVEALAALRQGALSVRIDSAVDYLVKHSAGDVQFFHSLAQARSKRSEEVWRIAKAWGIPRPEPEPEPDPAPAPDRGPSHKEARPRWIPRQQIVIAAAVSLVMFAAGVALGRWVIPHRSEPAVEPVMRPGKLPFRPSNIDLTGLNLEGLGDLNVDAGCTLTTDSKGFAGFDVGDGFEVPATEKATNCGNTNGIDFKLLTQADGSRVGVYFARSVRVGRSGRIRFWGAQAIALVAVETMEVFGSIDASPMMIGILSPGGFNGGALGRRHQPGGPGGGRARHPKGAGDGGSFCGVGGRGATQPGAPPSDPGMKYGVPRLVPLIGGSGGGDDSSSGSGGGALQLIAGKSITVAEGGQIISSGSGGGTYVSATEESLHGYGGGSGGAILLEALHVVVTGSLTADGGAGTILSREKTEDKDTNYGGEGNTEGDIDGKPGTLRPDGSGGGGGGGAGRIRVNTWDGRATITGKVSPALTTECVTSGRLERPDGGD